VIARPDRGLAPFGHRGRFEVEHEQRHRDGESAVAQRGEPLEAAAGEPVVADRHRVRRYLTHGTDVHAYAGRRLEEPSASTQTSDDFSSNRVWGYDRPVEPVTDIRSFAVGLIVLVIPR
jgi:hypothetical protein